MKHILLLIIATIGASAHAASPYENVPEFELSQSVITIPSHIRGFQGDKPKNSDTISYPLLVQSFLNKPIRIEIPSDKPDLSVVPTITSNPYKALLASIKLDSIGDTPGRLLLTAPECKENFEKLFVGPFSDGTIKLLQGKSQIELLLTVLLGDKLTIIYYLIDQSGSVAKVPYLRVFKKINDQYLMDCSPISDPALLNINGAIMLKGTSSVKVE